QGGSFATAGGYLSGQYTEGKNSASISANGFMSDRYLDPTVVQNFTNHGTGSSFDALFERDITDRDRVRVSASHGSAHFLVPNELLQEMAGQREDRVSEQSSGQASYQHIFSAGLIGALRGMVRDVSANLWSNPLATPIAPSQNRGF